MGDLDWRPVQWLKNTLHDSLKREAIKTNGHVEVQLHR